MIFIGILLFCILYCYNIIHSVFFRKLFDTIMWVNNIDRQNIHIFFICLCLVNNRGSKTDCVYTHVGNTTQIN